MGRRAENRRDTFRRVVAAADALFGESGVDAVTVEQIAAVAHVSPGTVYNHFGTKGAIVVAVVANRSASATREVATGLDLDHDRPIDAVMAVLMTYLEPMLELDRRLIGTVIAASFDPSRILLMEQFSALDHRVLGRLVDLLATLDARGGVRPGTDATQAASIVFAVGMLAMIEYVADPSMPPGAVAPQIRSQLELVFRGLGAAP